MPSLLCTIFKKKRKMSSLDESRGDDYSPAGSNGRPSSTQINGASSKSSLGTGSPSKASSRTPLSLQSNVRRSKRDDDSSLPTIDPDYNRSSDNYSLSDAGGTIGSQSVSIFGLQTSSQRGTFGSNGATYEQALYNNSQQYQQHQPTQSIETLEIYAPSGKLGVVIDVTSHSSTPIVHAIKDTCPIRDEIRVGDELYFVDDVDVRRMTAVEVSRLISRKCHQEARKLTVGRKTSHGVGMMSDNRLFNLQQFGM